jgi:hypothetical protein
MQEIGVVLGADVLLSGPEGGEGVAAWCIGDIGDEGD